MPRKRKAETPLLAFPETHWSPTQGKWVIGPTPHGSPITPSRVNWYAAVRRMIWTFPVVPEAAVVAEKIEQIAGDSPPDLPSLLDRLRHWPAGEPYVPIPDDDVLEMRVFRRKAFDQRAWMPGSVRGSTEYFDVRKTPSTKRQTADERVEAEIQARDRRLYELRQQAADVPPPPEYPEEATRGL